MKKRAIITYLLALALLLSACLYRIPDSTSSSDPAMQESENFSSGSDTSPSAGKDATSPQLGEFRMVSVSTVDYRYGPCNYREITLIINGEEISGMTLYECVEVVEELIIPSEINGLPVVAIGTSNLTHAGGVFYNNKSIKKVVIPDTVCFIGGYSFANCTELGELELPASVKWIDQCAFMECEGLKALRITPDMKLDLFAVSGATGLQSVVIEEGVTFIPSFNNCAALTELKLPSTITYIGRDGSDGNEPYFYGTSITFIEIPEGVTYLGMYLFQGSKLESIILPKTLLEVSDDTFATDTLKAVFYRGSAAYFLGDILDDIDATIYCYSETEPTEEGNFWHYVDGMPVIW